MKTTIVLITTAAVLHGSIAHLRAGDREWAVAGKVLTGIVAASVLARAIEPAHAPAYCPPPVVTVIAPAPVVWQPAPVTVIAPPPTVWVHSAPVVYAPAPRVVYVEHPPVIYRAAPVLVYRHQPSAHHHHHHFHRHSRFGW